MKNKKKNFTRTTDKILATILEKHLMIMRDWVHQRMDYSRSG